MSSHTSWILDVPNRTFLGGQKALRNMPYPPEKAPKGHARLLVEAQGVPEVAARFLDDPRVVNSSRSSGLRMEMTGSTIENGECMLGEVAVRSPGVSQFTERTCDWNPVVPIRREQFPVGKPAKRYSPAVSVSR